MMITLEQKIGAKLISLMPQGIDFLEVQVHTYPEYNMCLALTSDADGYQDALIDQEALEEISTLVCLLQTQKNNSHGQWTHCHMIVHASQCVQFHFLQSSFFYSSSALFQAHEAQDTQQKSLLSSLEKQPLQEVTTFDFQYEPTMLFALALDYATGLNGIDINRNQAKQHFKNLIQNDRMTLAAYYNWVALECGSQRYVEETGIDFIEMLRRARQSDVAALYVLGLMYHSGFNAIEPNIKQAMHYYRLAAGLGCRPAAQRVEDLYLGISRKKAVTFSRRTET